MEEKTLKTRIKLLKNTDDFFREKNVQTLNGELYIVETDKGPKFKVGDGIHTYSEIDFYEENLLSILGFSLEDVSDGQILMYDSETLSWKNVDPSDAKSVVFLPDSGFSIKGYNSANHGQVLVKDSELGLIWVDPVSDESLQRILAGTEEARNTAGAYATQAGEYAINADRAALTAQRINQQTMNFINEKFWWGTLEEYNNLEEIKEGTFYFLQI